MIREVNVSQLTDVVERLCIEANEHLPSDVKCAIEHCRACEDGEIAQGVLDNIIENYKIADAENVPICQDTGMGTLGPVQRRYRNRVCRYAEVPRRYRRCYVPL